MSLLLDFLPNMGDRLTLLRVEKGLTQKEMAALLGVSKRAYHSYEKGERGTPIEALAHLKQHLGQSADWILFGESSNQMIDVDTSDFEAVCNQIDGFVQAEQISISAKNLNKVRAMWLESAKRGEPALFAIVTAWIDALKD